MFQPEKTDSIIQGQLGFGLTRKTLAGYEFFEVVDYAPKSEAFQKGLERNKEPSSSESIVAGFNHEEEPNWLPGLKKEAIHAMVLLASKDGTYSEEVNKTIKALKDISNHETLDGTFIRIYINIIN